MSFHSEISPYKRTGFGKGYAKAEMCVNDRYFNHGPLSGHILGPKSAKEDEMCVSKVTSGTLSGNKKENRTHLHICGKLLPGKQVKNLKNL